MEILLGKMGAGLGLAFFYAGKAAGAKPAASASAVEKTEDKGQEAFRVLQSYSAEQAYGIGSGVVK